MYDVMLNELNSLLAYALLTLKLKFEHLKSKAPEEQPPLCNCHNVVPQGLPLYRCSTVDAKMQLTTYLRRDGRQGPAIP